jgi:DNA-binding IclR family transcriptional regulator
MKHPASGHIQSVQRACALLKAFGNGASELGVAELGRKLSLHKSTASRLLATLESEGLLERAPGGDKYRLGYEFVRLAGQVPRSADVRAAARPFLTELAAASNETVHLAVLDGGEVVNVEQVSSPHIVRMKDWVGRRTPLHCVANGKALLAFLPETDLARVLAGPLARFTPHTLTTKTALRAELERVRARGYAIAQGEIEEGLNAVAAPVRDAAGNVVAALSVSGPAYRMTAAKLPKLAELTKSIADKISARLR